MLPLIYILATFACAPVKTLGIRQFSVESRAMEPTLRLHSVFAVHRCGYGLSRYTYDGFELPIVGRLPSITPVRGDAIVFRPPKIPGEVWFKRVIGLPGDIVELRRGRVYINGILAERQFLRREVLSGQLQGHRTEPVYRETLPAGRSYLIYQDDSNEQLDTVPAVRVEAGKLYVLGDNREDSYDSRMAWFGQIPMENVIGPIVATGGWLWPQLLQQQ